MLQGRRRSSRLLRLTKRDAPHLAVSRLFERIGHKSNFTNWQMGCISGYAQLVNHLMINCFRGGELICPMA
jgi:hypothetical protein